MCPQKLLCFMAVPNGKAYIHVCPFFVYISPSSGGEGFGGRS